MDFRRTRLHSVSGDLIGLPPADRPEVVVVGRSNVGKSSMVNAIGDNRTLARVSSIPGKTRLLIAFDVDGVFRIMDLPGYGYARVAQGIKKRFSGLVDGYLSSGRDIRMALHIVDVRHEPTKEDRIMRDWLTAKEIPTITVLTKADKISRNEILQKTQIIRTTLGLAESDRTIVFSAETRAGVDELRAALTKAIDLSDS